MRTEALQKVVDLCGMFGMFRVFVDMGRRNVDGYHGAQARV